MSDQEDGDADGAPILENRSCYRSWAQVLSAEYKSLRNKTRKGRRSVIRSYGATNPAEFFAVATEATVAAEAVRCTTGTAGTASTTPTAA